MAILGSRAVALFVALFVVARLSLAQPAENVGGVIYAAQAMPFKAFYRISDTAGMQNMELVSNMTDRMNDSDFPPQCVGHNLNTGLLNTLTPNALASDGQERLFFSAYDSNQVGDERVSQLCYYSMSSDEYVHIGEVQDILVVAAMELSSYSYVYIRQGTTESSTLHLVFLKLDRETAQIMEEILVMRFLNAAEPSAPRGSVDLVYRGGDIAISCERILYGSSVGNAGGDKVFFRIDLNSMEYKLIHEDPRDISGQSTLTGFATGDQLAVDTLGRLISQNADRGIFSLVDVTTGANGEIGVEGTDFWRFYDTEGEALTFTDISSFMKCSVLNGCMETQTMNQCTGELMTALVPQENGDVSCTEMEGFCASYPDCVDSVPCTYFSRMETPVDPMTFGFRRK